MADRILEGRHALVTGGGTGIGEAIAGTLALRGASLSLLGRRVEPLQRVAERSGGLALSCDVTDRDQLARAFDDARREHGPIDILVVNAGVGDSAPFAKIERADWDRLIAVNLTAAFDCAQAALSDLLQSPNGRIVFVASVAGLKGAPYAAHYAASKHGLIGLMRSMALEFARTGMTVNAVCPGFVDTPMTDQTVARISAKSGRDEHKSRLAVEAMNASGRLVRPEAIAAIVGTLCGPESADVNGAAITIDGGTTA